jgi:hypothetical protein
VNARNRKLLGLLVLAFILMLFFVLIFSIGAHADRDQGQ